VLVLGLIGLLSLRQVGSLDAGFHLRTGAYILQGHWPPSTDPFSFTMKDHPYTDTSWGYDVILALLERAGGAPALVGLHALLVLGTFLVILLTVRLGPGDPAGTVLLMLAGGLASEMRFEVRPELVSYFLLGLVLYLLHRHAEGRLSPLWTLPLIHLVWANMHALFVLGWAAIACFVVGLSLRRFTLDTRLLGWGAASMAVTLVNPYGLRGVLFPLTLMTRLRQDNLFAQAIGEFVSPFSLGLSQRYPFYPAIPIFCFRLLLVLSVAAAVGLLFQRRFASLLLWAGSLYLAAHMIRNLPLFVVASLPGIIWGLPLDRMQRAAGLGDAARRAIGRSLVAAASLVAILLGLQVVHDGYYLSSRRTERFGWDWNRLELPIDAVRYAGRARITGPVLNHLNFGGWLMWARPDPVFIDGRLEVVGESFFAEYRNALASEAALEAAAQRYGIRWLIFPYAGAPELLGRVSKDPRWRLAYRDHLAAIFVREGPGAASLVDPALARELSEAGGGAREEMTASFQGLPGLDGRPRPTRLERWGAGLVRARSFPSREFGCGLFHTYRGELGLAQGCFADAIRRSGGAYYEMYSNLGSVLFRRKEFEEAKRCYAIVLEERPDDRLARERMAALGRRPPGS
jgi:tetratricopeptide (TPR) repeat protein